MTSNLNSTHERGQSFTELAVSMTFLLILMAGLLDLGRVFFTYTAMRDAVQEGASYLAMYPTRCTETVDRIRDHTTQPIDLSDPTIQVVVLLQGTACATVDPDTICPGDDIDVTITFNDFNLATPFLGTFLGTQTFSLQAEVTDSVIIDPDPNQGPACP